MSTAIRVGGDHGYDVVVGSGLLGEHPSRVSALLGDGVERVLLVSCPAVQAYADEVARGLEAGGRQVVRATVPDAEAAKSAGVAAALWGTLGQHGFTRSDAVVSVGGGSVTDLAGFVAATWLRGVAVVHVPTTLLAMVDAAVGGKTGINTAEGKNLVGAFHEPAGVLCDLDLLGTLPEADLAAGLAEVVKAGFIRDPVILDLVEGDPVGARRGTSATLAEMVRRAISVKADVVTADLRESYLREILNYGHTFGHAIEQVERYRWRHGEAVSVGLVYAAELAHAHGRIGSDLLERHRQVLVSLGLPVTYRGDRFDALHTAMTRDKKARGSRLRFVVLDALAVPGRLDDPSTDSLRQAYRAVSA